MTGACGPVQANAPDPARDRRLVYAAAFVRALATGMVGVLLGIYLARRGFDPAETGVVVASGLSGAALAALLVTISGDTIGRRRMLVSLALLAAAGGLVLAATAGPTVTAAAAFLGMVNGMGRDRGGSLVIDQAILPATASAAQRTGAFARYNVLQDVGHALGGLLAALPALLRRSLEIDELASLRAALCVYAALMLVTAPLYARLSRGVEAATAVRHPVSAASRRVLWRISSLFALDSLAGGFLTTALLVFFFFERFGIGEVEAAGLFFAARVLNAASHLAAAWLSKRIGLLNTMVFTHIPSSLLLASVAFAPSFPVAAVLFLLREGLVEMDVPTRQSYVMAVVRPEERTFASGVTHLVRLGAWAAGPVIAGLLMQGSSLATPLFVGAGMKITYDVLLGITFRRVLPPEER